MLGIDSGTLPPLNARIFTGLMLCSFWEGNCWCWKLMCTTILLCSQVSTFLLFSNHLFLHYFISNIDFYHTIYYDNIFSRLSTPLRFSYLLSLWNHTLSVSFRKEIGWEKRKPKAWFQPEEVPLRKSFHKVRLESREGWAGSNFDIGLVRYTWLWCSIPQISTRGSPGISFAFQWPH